MQLLIQVCAYAVGLPLELLIIAAMLRGSYKQFPFVFLYTLVDFLTTIIEIRPSLAYESRTPEAVREWRMIYWIDERIMDTLVFLVVIGLIYAAAVHLRPRRIVLAGVAAGTLLFAGTSLLIHYSPRLVLGKWMTPWTRDLNVCGAVLDLALWTMLITPRKKNYVLLALSGALGIRFTGEAIGQSLRHIAVSLQSGSSWTGLLVMAGNYLLMAANLVCLFIWWRTFRRRASDSPVK